jgi:hypothetical protein
LWSKGARDALEGGADFGHSLCSRGFARMNADKLTPDALPALM